MLSIHFYFEIKDINVKCGRFLKSGIIVSQGIKFVIYSSSVNFQPFGEFSDLNLEWSGQGSLYI